jgi:hypothetical protein
MIRFGPSAALCSSSFDISRYSVWFAGASSDMKSRPSTQPIPTLIRPPLGESYTLLGVGEDFLKHFHFHALEEGPKRFEIRQSNAGKISYVASGCKLSR